MNVIDTHDIPLHDRSSASSGLRLRSPFPRIVIRQAIISLELASSCCIDFLIPPTSIQVMYHGIPGIAIRCCLRVSVGQTGQLTYGKERPHPWPLQPELQFLAINIDL